MLPKPNLDEMEEEPTYVAVDLTTTCLVEDGFLKVQDELRRRIIPKGVTPIEDLLLTMREADLTPRKILEMMRSNPCTSLIVIASKTHATTNINMLAHKQKEYQSKKELAAEFIEIQIKAIKGYQQQMAPTNTKVEKLRKEVQDLVKQLKEKKKELKELLPDKNKNDTMIAGLESSKADAQVSSDNASQVINVCGALGKFLQTMVTCHDNSPELLPFANMADPLEMGAELGIVVYEYFTGGIDGKPKDWYHLHRLYLHTYFFGLRVQLCMPFSLSSFPKVTTKTGKKELTHILCRLCGITPPQELIAAIQNEAIAKIKKRKREEEEGPQYMEELTDKCRKAGVDFAKAARMEGRFHDNLYALFKEQCSPGAPSKSSSNENSAGNDQNSSTDGPSSSNDNSAGNGPGSTASGH